jgi:hypothetical protein
LSRTRCNCAQKITSKTLKLFAVSTFGGDGAMSSDVTKIISFDRFRWPGTYTEALLEQSHEREAAARSAKFLDYGWRTDKNVICSKTTLGILESHLDSKTMEVDHFWTSFRENVPRIVKDK